MRKAYAGDEATVELTLPERLCGTPMGAETNAFSNGVVATSARLEPCVPL